MRNAKILTTGKVVFLFNIIIYGKAESDCLR